MEHSLKDFQLALCNKFQFEFKQQSQHVSGENQMGQDITLYEHAYQITQNPHKLTSSAFE